MPESGGRCLRNAVNARKPPADAPTPTIGHECFWAVDCRGVALGSSSARDTVLASTAERFDRLEILAAMPLFSCHLWPAVDRSRAGPIHITARRTDKWNSGAEQPGEYSVTAHNRLSFSATTRAINPL